MKVIKIDLSDQYRVQQFIDLPFRIYREIEQWVPPLATNLRNILNPQKNPFFKHSSAAFFLAVMDDGSPVGRLVVLNNRNFNNYNHTKIAFFYLFECYHDSHASLKLFNTGFDWARDQDLESITGPKGFSAVDGMGLLVKGFEHRPAFGIPYNLSYYPELIEMAGFLPAGDIVSGYLGADIQFPDKINRVAELVQQRRGLHIARFRTRGDLRALVIKLKDLYNGTLEGTSGNVPLTDEEAKAMADQLIWFANPRLIKIIMKGEEPVGFLFAYPDISEAVQRTKGQIIPLGWIDLLLEMRRTKRININGAGILEQYRGLGGTAILFSEMFKSVAEGGYKHAEIVQIGVENDKMQRELRELGIDFYKTHRIYQRAL
jgi:hypothetical protein